MRRAATRRLFCFAKRLLVCVSEARLAVSDAVTLVLESLSLSRLTVTDGDAGPDCRRTSPGAVSLRGDARLMMERAERFPFLGWRRSGSLPTGGGRLFVPIFNQLWVHLLICVLVRDFPTWFCIFDRDKQSSHATTALRWTKRKREFRLLLRITLTLTGLNV